VQYVIGTTLCVVCYRVTDKPTPLIDSAQQQCVGCCEIIWVAKTSPPEPPKICIQCVQEGRPVADQPAITSGQMNLVHLETTNLSRRASVAFACFEKRLSFFGAGSLHTPFFGARHQHGGVVSLSFGLSQHSET
jgi:hypothetical protein